MKSSAERFLKACGAVGPLCIQVVNRASRRLTYQMLDQPFVVIGRDAHADIVLDHPDVGWRRAYVQVVDGRLFAMDLRTPIIGAERTDLLTPGWLKPGRSLAFGPFDVTVSIGDRAAPSAQPAPASEESPLTSRYADREPLHNVTLNFQNKVKRNLTWPMDRVLAILGQSADCKIHLKSSSVSNFHCSLVRTRFGVWVLDLLGRGGISVHGRPVRFARLADGDLLKVGDFLIEMRCSPPVSGSVRRGQVPALREPPGSRGIDRRSSSSFLPGIASLAPAGEPASSQLPGENPARPGPNPPADAWTTEVMSPVDPASKALFDQFGLMQQQMVEQFDRVVSMMCQMFTAMHREQSTQVREELEQIRRLTQELTVLKAEQVALRAEQSSPSDPAILTMPQRDAYDRSPSEPVQAIADLGPEEGVEEAAEPLAPNRVEGPDLRPAVASMEDRDPAAQQPAEPEEPVPGRQRTSAHASEDIHLRLSRRIAEIQQEQRGRLQRLLSLVTGR